MVLNAPSPIPVSIPSHFPVLAMLCLLSLLHTLSLQRIAWHSRVCSIPLANLLDESIHSKVRTLGGCEKNSRPEFPINLAKVLNLRKVGFTATD